MLALGVGGWLAGLMHLVTHAFFKSLLFMCSGSVIHAVHTNEMPQMGGLLKKMPITGFTMLVGCLAIAGVSVPFVVGFSGYYSKDAILEQAFAFMQQNQGSFLPTMFFVTAAGGAAMTAFYMFRLWYMTFLGKPRDQHRYDHAHESPKVMYMPLVILAVLATGVAWKGPWEAVYVAVGAAVLGIGLYIYHQVVGGEDAETRSRGRTICVTLFGSSIGLVVLAGLWSVVGINLHDLLESARPGGTTVNTQGVLTALVWPDEHFAHLPAQFWSIVFPVTMLATATALSGILLATVIYAWGYLSPDEVRRQFQPVYRFLINKWWFDELYAWVFVKPVLLFSRLIARFDRRWIDGFIDATARGVRNFAIFWERLADQNIVDGLVNLVARWTYAIGLSLRTVQTGRLRQYVMFIVIAALAIFVLISVFWSPTLAQ
jgi:NADH-quinone oxidoreductase subunit L